MTNSEKRLVISTALSLACSQATSRVECHSFYFWTRYRQRKAIPEVGLSVVIQCDAESKIYLKTRINHDVDLSDFHVSFIVLPQAHLVQPGKWVFMAGLLFDYYTGKNCCETFFIALLSVLSKNQNILRRTVFLISYSRYSLIKLW